MVPDASRHTAEQPDRSIVELQNASISSKDRKGVTKFHHGHPVDDIAHFRIDASRAIMVPSRCAEVDNGIGEITECDRRAEHRLPHVKRIRS